MKKSKFYVTLIYPYVADFLLPWFERIAERKAYLVGLKKRSGKALLITRLSHGGIRDDLSSELLPRVVLVIRL